jgi:hypothetical protein
MALPVLALPLSLKGGQVMKKIAVVFALAFAFATGMAVVSVVVHPDRAMAIAPGQQLPCIQSRLPHATAHAANGDVQKCAK